MVTPLQFMERYRNITVYVEVDDNATKMCRSVPVSVKLNKYFMMNWTAGTDQAAQYAAVTAGSSKVAWFRQHQERIRTAAMGKGSPEDYALALQWAVYSNHIQGPSQATTQAFFDREMGIDCSGFVTNYLIANGKKSNSSSIQRNTSAASYFSAAQAVNNPGQVRQGDLLVFMLGNSVLTSPGHVAVVESYIPQSMPSGNMRVVEATGASGANPKLLDSMYSVESIIDKGGAVPCMIFVVKRHGVSGSRVAIIRV
jgi:hypothetical protein